MLKSKLKSALAGAVLLSGLVGGSASAAVLTLYGDWNSVQGGSTQYDATEVRGTVTCTSCEGLTTDTPTTTWPNNNPTPLPTLDSGDESWSGIAADMFYLPNSSSQGEIDWVNLAIAPAPATTGNSGQVSGGGSQDVSITTNALYLLLKIGQNPQYALIRNTSAGQQEQTYHFLGLTGLSHFVAFNGRTPPEITVPEPGSLALLGLGLAGLAAIRRRRPR